MKTSKHKLGLTLVEILVTVAIIAILITMVIGIASRIDSQSKEQLTKNTLALLDAALGQFQDYGYEYKIYASAGPTEVDFFHSLKFPIDCNELSTNNFKSALGRALGSARGTTEIIITGAHDPSYSGSEAMYFFLNKIPECRKTLDKIDKSLITNLGSDGKSMEIEIKIDGDFKYPLFRVIDPWGTTLRYDYYSYETGSYANRMNSRKTFPVITSAGPDKEFGTADDITSR
jgi:prepilin-type N-terminal cleavage/methylation domain-containing protein